MTVENRTLNGIENEVTPDAQGNNEVSLQAEMISDKDGLDEIHSEGDMRAAFASIREEAEMSVSSAELRLLYRRGADFIELLDLPAFQERVGARLDVIRKVAEEEFARMARTLNQRGAELDVKADYSEKWLGKTADRPWIAANQAGQ